MHEVTALATKVTVGVNALSLGLKKLVLVNEFKKGGIIKVPFAFL